MILGIGIDCHTASLFPNNETYIRHLKFTNTEIKDNIVIGMYVESQQENRISLTSQFINQSKKKILYAYGDDKLATLHTAIKSNNIQFYPILSVIDDLELYTLKSNLVDELR